ncbi:hypothetical protein [Desulfatibacillum aliphaticivorans]|uniref:hypothetical protein n=1 Tax=Desulfatibacillum aliphaticivorans TaxID=218208 RepID=UPI0004868AA8|nr:hypothetical protein [Desulfatibacillum aliphaticivorans]
MKRIKYGVLKKLAKHSQMSANYLSDVVNGHKGITKSRAKELENLSFEALGLQVSAILWMFGPPEDLKAALSKPCPSSKENTA